MNVPQVVLEIEPYGGVERGWPTLCSWMFMAN